MARKFRFQDTQNIEGETLCKISNANYIGLELERSYNSRSQSNLELIIFS